MVNNTKKALKQINEVSRQLLSRILIVQKKTQENTTITNESKTGRSITDNELTELMSKRDSLIHCLFDQKTTSDVAQELTLLNEMVSLDNEISSISQACKKILAEQIIRIKKSKKVSKSYQKY
ncbi:hypothetical protein [Colwellia sp. TT2012]|uniref:hypothetical protein n=1 Tax=Colwellia sp. TT2012 TaxID=1720342 RepID=UPI00070BE8BD|nr:hypothetical protein [Colwellia sp. TT2012]